MKATLTQFPALRRVLAAVICAATLAFQFNAAAAARPNIVFFFADDLGWTGLRCFGSDLYETPNLDRLAAEGMKFTDAYSACTVCSPSRAAVMTGKYPARLHLTDFIAGQDRPFTKLRIPNWQKWLKHEEVTIAQALAIGGYKTAQVGKWHLNRKDAGAKGYDPVDHGFDRQVMKPPAKGYFLTKPAGGFKKGDFTTDYLASEAAKIVDEWKNDPFFLYFAFHVPHTPIMGKQELIDAYAKKVQPNAKHNNPTYAAMVHSMDEAVGKVIDQLEKSGVADNTVIVFTSDNGGLTQRYGKHDGFTDNYPLRRGKGSAYEGGVRVPFIVKWPGVTTAGTTCREPVIGIDYYPTFLEIAGIKGDAKHNQNVDGLSLVPLFKNPKAALKRDAIYWHYPHYHAGGDGPYNAVRSRDWRLVQFYEDGSEALYNLKDDLHEQADVAGQNAAVAAKLRNQLDNWRIAVKAQMLMPNPNHDPAKATQVSKRGRKK
jgi:arylsulfatase A-like enzyme